MKKKIRIRLLLFLVITLRTYSQDSIEGVITSIENQQTLLNMKINMEIFDPPLGLTEPTWTDIHGHYSIDYLTDINQNENINSEFIIKYLGNSILTNNSFEKRLKVFNLLGEEVINLSTFEKNIDLKVSNLVSGRYITALNFKNQNYYNLMLVRNGNLIALKKIMESGIEKQQLNKVNYRNVSASIFITDTTFYHHSYTRGPVVPWPGYWNGHIVFNMVLPKVVYLPDSMKFTSPRGTYPINTEIRLWQHMAGVTDPNHYLSIGRKLMPLEFYLDTLNCKPEWKEALRNGINNIRDQTTHNPDSLVHETNEYKELQFENGFSQINITYTDSIGTGQRDYFITVTYDNDNDTFIGAELQIDTSRGLQPIDVQKIIQRTIQSYVTGAPNPIDNPKYMGTGTRGEPYNITTPEMNLIDMTRTFQDIIVQNSGQRIFINRFLHPGTVITSKPTDIKDRKVELLELFNKVPDVKIKIIE